VEFTLDQKQAIYYCCDTNRRIVSVTGPAGSGKTTIMREAVKRLRERGRNVCLCAPTGRAARRISEATGYPAVTIHRMLGYGKPEIDTDTGIPTETTRPRYNNAKPMPFHDVFVDEYMMVPEYLHRDLMDGLRPGARVLAFGDVHQLPPIEEYALNGFEKVPFERMLKFPSAVRLDTVFRQAEGSGLLSNAERIRHGKPPLKTSDFFIEVTDVPVRALRLHVERSPILYGTLDNQIICPTRKGEMGVYALNALLQPLVGPHVTAADRTPLEREKWQKDFPVAVAVGDKVICNENIYDMRDFWTRFERYEDDVPVWDTFVECPENLTMLNGEIGIVSDILGDGSLDIELPDRMVQMPASYRDYIARFDRVYLRDPRKKLDLAYAVTTHKMQGSECQHVVYMMNKSIAYMQNRNNFYTGVTRARESVYLITDVHSLQNAANLSAMRKAEIRELNKKRKPRDDEPF
jgi:exodeoxyribonuclease V alpha subunit